MSFTHQLEEKKNPDVMAILQAHISIILFFIF